MARCAARKPGWNDNELQEAAFAGGVGVGRDSFAGGVDDGFFGDVELAEVAFEHQASLGVEGGHATEGDGGDWQVDPLQEHEE